MSRTEPRGEHDRNPFESPPGETLDEAIWALVEDGYAVVARDDAGRPLRDGGELVFEPTDKGRSAAKAMDGTMPGIVIEGDGADTFLRALSQALTEAGRPPDPHPNGRGWIVRRPPEAEERAILERAEQLVEEWEDGDPAPA
jgi:hypothetical protein